MKKILVLGMFIAGFAMSSMAQNVAQPVENTPAVEVAKVAPAEAVAPAKPCCKKEGSAGCSKAGAANGEVKACCKKEGASAAAGAPKAGCNGATVGASAAPAIPATEKKHCGSDCQKPCCKKGN